MELTRGEGVAELLAMLGEAEEELAELRLREVEAVVVAEGVKVLTALPVGRALALPPPPNVPPVGEGEVEGEEDKDIVTVGLTSGESERDTLPLALLLTLGLLLGEAQEDGERVRAPTVLDTLALPTPALPLERALSVAEYVASVP